MHQYARSISIVVHRTSSFKILGTLESNMPVSVLDCAKEAETDVSSSDGTDI